MNCPHIHRVLALVVLVLFSTPHAMLSCVAAESDSYQEVLDLDQAAVLLRVEPDVIRELAEARQIPARRVGNLWRFSRAALLEWLKGGQLPGAPGASPEPPSNLDRSETTIGELRAVSGRGTTPESSVRIAAEASDKQPPASSPQPAIGEHPTAPTAEEIALRDQWVLLKKGGATVDFGVAYSYSERTLYPAIRQEQRSTSAAVAVRYGLLNDLQITARTLGIWSRTTTYTDAAISGTTAPRITRDDYAGDGSLSLLGVAMRETVGAPNIIWSIDSVVPTGPGDRGLGGGLVLSKSYDPAVIFAGLNYLQGYSVDPADPRRSLARHNVGLSSGYTYALNDSLALNTTFTGIYRNSSSPDGLSIPPPRERYFIQLGMTWLVARGLFMEPAVAMRVGGESPDLTVSLNIPYSF